MGNVRTPTRIPALPRTPSVRQVDVLREYALTGSQKQVAANLGIQLQTVKNHLAGVYMRLGADNMIEAFRLMGWIHVPDKSGVVPCGWTAYCGRPEGHHGNHGGFRPFLRAMPMPGEDLDR